MSDDEYENVYTTGFLAGRFDAITEIEGKIYQEKIKAARELVLEKNRYRVLSYYNIALGGILTILCVVQMFRILNYFP